MPAAGAPAIITRSGSAANTTCSGRGKHACAAAQLPSACDGPLPATALLLHTAQQTWCGLLLPSLRSAALCTRAHSPGRAPGWGERPAAQTCSGEPRAAPAGPGRLQTGAKYTSLSAILPGQGSLERLLPTQVKGLHRHLHHLVQVPACPRAATSNRTWVTHSTADCTAQRSSARSWSPPLRTI